ncbi:ATP-dependent DNA ligase, partial [Streptomyces sp. SID8455]|nr:ATP-dependent DNA ligase [Streptomyces sp. SID8455]
LPYTERHTALARLVPEHLRVRRALVPEAGDADARRAADAFLAETLERGHEGVVVKDLAAAYSAGRRGASWLKVKPVHTLDLVV